jgi:hypothetical protein
MLLKTGGFDVVEAEKRWGEVAVAIRIIRHAPTSHIANRLREVYREYLEKYAQAVEQVCCCFRLSPVKQPLAPLLFRRLWSLCTFRSGIPTMPITCVFAGQC